MENSNGKDRPMNGRVRAMSARVCVPPLEPRKVLLWFTLLETEFELACITNDKLKFKTAIDNMRYQYSKAVAEIIYDPPETGQYETLKSVVIKELADPNATKVWKLLEDQRIENRMPSQFYKELKRLAGRFISDDILLTLWINRLPPSVQQAVDVVKETDADALTEMADRIYTIWLEKGRTTAVSAEQTTAIGEHSHCVSDTLYDRVSRLEAQTRTLTLGHCQPTSLQQPGLFHRSLSDCASKCHYPCNWNQNQGNATQSSTRSVITTYDVDMWGSIYVKDFLSEYSFLVDTGASLSTFPRNKVPGRTTRIKDENFYLIAANGARIDTYGPIQVYLNLGAKWKFQWQFIVADVIEPTIGMDFMQYHGFLVDTQNKCLFKPTEPAYEVLCHGCHWGMNAPHKPNPLIINSLPELPNPKRQAGLGRGRLHEAERVSSATFRVHNIVRPGWC
ncbi:uncharacterized protein [Bombus flavifrons]|uniref:uncharacterized protein n=1 Tax=Bombus flavifrons TaxID=103934 RepID=UPI003703A631